MAKNSDGYKMSEIDYWLWLSLKKDMTSEKMEKLLTYFRSPEDIFNMSREELLSVKGLNKRVVAVLADKSLETVFRVKEECRKYDIKILTFDSPYYPENLKHIPAPPYVLYTRNSKQINLNEYIRIAMVGNRESTKYGESAAKEIAYDLANNGIVVVSGMANGIDTASHRGALAAGGITVAVMGCGLNRAYPPENIGLMEEIIETGIAISEYPPGDKPDAWHFPRRNRIISGIAQGTLVVEAPKRSGSLITADYAVDQGKDLFAVPGDINKEHSVGTNNLLKQYATPVTSARDIFDYYSVSYSEISKIRELQKKKGVLPQTEYKEKEKEKKANINDEKYKDLNDSEKSIITKLIEKNSNFDELLESTQIPADKLTSLITMLEIKGKIKTLPGKIFTLNT